MRFDSCPNDWSASHPDGVAEGGAPCTLSNFFFLSIPRYVAWAGEPPGRFGPMHEKGGMFEQSTVAGSTEYVVKRKVPYVNCDIELPG